MIRVDGFGPVAGVLSATMYPCTTPAAFAAADITDVQASQAAFITGDALPHLPSASWPLPAGLRAFVCWPERRPSARDRLRLLQSAVQPAAAQRDVTRLALLLNALAVGDPGALRTARLQSGRDELLGRLCPGFFPARLAAWEAGALLVSFSDTDGGIFVLAESDESCGAAAQAMKTVFDVHSQPATWAFMAGAES